MFHQSPFISLSVAPAVRAACPRGEDVRYVNAAFVAYDLLCNPLNLNRKDSSQ
jgi:hypothetical protein